MKKNCILTAATMIVLWSAGLSAGSAYIEESKETIATSSFSDSDPTAIIAQHDSWDANSLGNHRVVIDVSRAAGEVGLTQITDAAMIDAGRSYQADVDGNLAAKTTIVAFGQYLNTLSSDQRSDTQECFKSTIEYMEWLDNYYVDVNTEQRPRGNYQLGDNKASAEILAAGWNGGPGAIDEGFGDDATWNVEDVGAAKDYAKDVAGRAYP